MPAGDFCAIFDGSPFELIAPLTYMGSSKPRELFSNLKFKPGWGEREGKALELAKRSVPREKAQMRRLLRYHLLSTGMSFDRLYGPVSA
jgi:hypothetical protein